MFEQWQHNAENTCQIPSQRKGCKHMLDCATDVLPEQQSGVLPELVSATPWSIQHLRCGYDAANLGTKMVEEIISCCKKKNAIFMQTLEMSATSVIHFVVVGG